MFTRKIEKSNLLKNNKRENFRKRAFHAQAFMIRKPQLMIIPVIIDFFVFSFPNMLSAMATTSVFCQIINQWKTLQKRKGNDLGGKKQEFWINWMFVDQYGEKKLARNFVLSFILNRTEQNPKNFSLFHSCCSTSELSAQRYCVSSAGLGLSAALVMDWWQTKSFRNSCQWSQNTTNHMNSSCLA